MPPRKLGLYLARHYGVWLATVAAALTCLALLGDLLETARLASKAQDGYGTAFYYSLLRLPSLVNAFMPFVILLAAMLCFWRLSERRELIIMRMGGLSVWQFASPLLVIATGIGIMQILILDPAATAGLRRFQELTSVQNATPVRPQFAFSESGVWLHESDDEGSRILRAQYIDTRDIRNNSGGAVLGKVDFLLLDRQENYLYRIKADAARLRGQQWELFNASIIRPGSQIVRHARWQLPTGLSVDDLNHYYRPPSSLMLWQLPAYIETAKGKGADTGAHQVRFHNLLATPVVLMAMILLAAYFSIPTKRTPSAARTILFTTAAGIAFFLLSTFATKLAETNLLLPLPAVWLPPILALLAGGALLLQSEDA